MLSVVPGCVEVILYVGSVFGHKVCWLPLARRRRLLGVVAFRGMSPRLNAEPWTAKRMPVSAALT